MLRRAGKQCVHRACKNCAQGFKMSQTGPANRMHKTCTCTAQGRQICCTKPANWACNYTAQGLQIYCAGPANMIHRLYGLQIYCTGPADILCTRPANEEDIQIFRTFACKYTALESLRICCTTQCRCKCNAGPVQLACRSSVAGMQAVQLGCRPNAARMRARCNKNAATALLPIASQSS